MPPETSSKALSLCVFGGGVFFFLMRWVWAKFQVPNETSLKTHRVPVLHPDPDLFCHRGLFKYAAVKPRTNQDLGSRAFKAQVWAVCSPCCQWRPELNASRKTPGCAPHACGHPWSTAGVVQIPHPAGGRSCPGLPTASQPPLCAAIRQQRHSNAWSDRSRVLLNPQHCLYRKGRGLIFLTRVLHVQMDASTAAALQGAVQPHAGESVLLAHMQRFFHSWKTTGAQLAAGWAKLCSPRGASSCSPGDRALPHLAPSCFPLKTPRQQLHLKKSKFSKTRAKWGRDHLRIHLFVLYSCYENDTIIYILKQSKLP